MEVPDFVPGAGRLHWPSAERFQLQTHTLASWNTVVKAVNGKWENPERCDIMALLPQLAQAPGTVVELWGSHTHTPVQLFQQDTTHTLHLVKVWESDHNLRKHFVTRSHTATVTSSQHIQIISTSAFMWYRSASRWRNLLTEASSSLMPCCLNRNIITFTATTDT